MTGAIVISAIAALLLAKNRQKAISGVGTLFFGEQYTQFYHQPKKAIKFLKKKRSGECIAALYRPEIGDIDIVWGEVTNYQTHEGYGLAHIIEKHGEDIKALGFEVEDFVPIIVEYGNLKPINPNSRKFVLESDTFRVVIKKYVDRTPKRWLLTAFDLL